MKTAFITGASSGIGKDTAKLFSQNGWNVVATMRKPELENELNLLSNVEVIQCDVTSTESIECAIEKAIKRFGGIDVLINNAGYYTVGVLEAIPKEEIERQLNTNLLGLIETTQKVLPHLRKSQQGIIINISSIAGIVSIPLQTLYHATKFGVEGFTESLQFELAPFDIRVKLIEPGTIKTEFCGRSMTMIEGTGIPQYELYAKAVLKNLIRNGNNGSSSKGVAQTIYKAATDGRKKMRYTTGKMKEIIILIKILPTSLYQWIVTTMMEH